MLSALFNPMNFGWRTMLCTIRPSEFWLGNSAHTILKFNPMNFGWRTMLCTIRPSKFWLGNSAHAKFNPMIVLLASDAILQGWIL